MYSEQHIVKTRWGTFQLDDASYAAYLEGRSWISWDPSARQSEQPAATKPFIPKNISPEASRLREEAAHTDICYFLQERFPGRDVRVPYKSHMAELPIEEMNLSVRSSNALMRANARTFGRVKEIMEIEDGLKKIRNLGTKSEKEIVRSFFSSCYYHLTPVEQAVFWQKLIDANA
ncbi:MAG: hypothetical protein K6C12_13815 [Oscillospiraceae bacterium]|nr:hypothetical protein [Oscillospiraceae bacterium]